jgi:hypothetical protein
MSMTQGVFDGPVGADHRADGFGINVTGNDVTRSPWGNHEALKVIAISQDHNHLNSVEEVIGYLKEKSPTWIAQNVERKAAPQALGQRRGWRDIRRSSRRFCGEGGWNPCPG